MRTTVLDEYIAPRGAGRDAVTWFAWSLGLGVLTALWFVFSYGYIEDDAFIHLEFARSVAAGQGFAFNGLVTSGDTAPLWVLVLVSLHALGLEWMVTAKLACLLGLGSTVLAIVYLVRDLAADHASFKRLAPAAVAVTVLNPYFVHWSFSGMESVTALGVSLWAIRATFVRPPSWAGALTSVTLLGIGPLLRPELLLLAGAGVPVTLWRYWRASQETAVRLWSRLALLAAIGALPVLLWCVYALLTFGSPIPNTNMAKRGGGLSIVGPRLASVYAAGFLVPLLLFPLVALVRWSRGQRAPAAAVWVLALWPLLCVMFYLADHTLVQTRYCLLSMPCLSILTLWLLEDSARPLPLRLATGAMVLVSLLTVGLTVIPHVQNKKETVRLYAGIASFLENHVPKDAPVAVYAIGQLAFESRHPLVDVGGITRPSVIPYLNDPEATFQWAKRNGARYFISSHPPQAGAVPVYSITTPFLGWTFKHSSYGATEPLTVYRLP